MVFARFWRPAQLVVPGLDLDLDEGCSSDKLEGPEFRVTKLLRACGGCLGSRRRRRTWVAAISYGEPLTRL